MGRHTKQKLPNNPPEEERNRNKDIEKSQEVQFRRYQERAENLKP